MPPEIEDSADEIETVELADQDVATEVEKTEEAPAESSTAKDVSEPAEGDSLSIVRDVVEKGKQKSEAAASSATAEDDPATDGKATKEQKERDDENFSDAPFHKHPRFKELIAQRNEFREDAQRYRNVQSFVDEHGLSAEETADLIVIGGLMKTNPAEAWKKMKPVVEQVLRASGEILPTDLAQKVNAGEVPREAAQEISRSRASVSSMEAHTRWQQERQQHAQQRNAQAQIHGAVSSWEAERQRFDPNFAAKLPGLQREIAYLHATEGKPNTPEGVRAQLQKAYDAVSKTLPSSQPAPQKKAVKPVTGGQVNGNARPEIKSSLDAVNAVLAKRAG